MPAVAALRLTLIAAVLAAAAPSAALAAAATVSQNVNLRAGPSTDFGTLGELKPGAPVDVSKCQGRFCYVSSGLGKGWVSAAYLTRDPVLPPVQAATPAKPRVASTPALPPIAPQATQPRVATVPAGPPSPFPPAYEDNGDFLGAVPGPSRRAVGGFALGDVPLPQADVPGGNDRFVPENDPSLPDDAFVLPDRGGWSDYRRGDFRRFDRPRRDFGALPDGPDGDRACFTALDGGPGFCVRAGERRMQPAQWADRSFALANPARLDVTICTDAPYEDCRTVVASGPLHFDGGRSIVSVSVAAIGGY